MIIWFRSRRNDPRLSWHILAESGTMGLCGMQTVTDDIYGDPADDTHNLCQRCVKRQMRKMKP